MSVEQAVQDSLALLRELRTLDRDESFGRARALAARHLPLELRLVPERNEHSGQLEYGMLIRQPRAEILYVTCRADSSTPWLLHQVHDFREGMLLHVDGESLSIGDAVTMLDELLEHGSLQERMIDACILRRHFAIHDVPVSDAELQAAVDDFRQRRGLLDAAATRHWMHARGMSHARIEAVAATAVRVRKLRRELFAAHVESYFAAHRDELARASLIRLRFASVEPARRARSRCSSLAELLALGEEVMAGDLRNGERMPRIDSVVVDRSELDTCGDTSIFERPQRIVGPLVTPTAAYLAWVVALEPARELDPALRGVIERRLFADWLHDQRADATIEWNWGHDAE